VAGEWLILAFAFQVTWLASWTDKVQEKTKYMMLNAASKLRGQKDRMKFELARKLSKNINILREKYRKDWTSKTMQIRQRAVALYFIDLVCPLSMFHLWRRCYFYHRVLFSQLVIIIVFIKQTRSSRDEHVKMSQVCWLPFVDWTPSFNNLWCKNYKRGEKLDL